MGVLLFFRKQVRAFDLAFLQEEDTWLHEQIDTLFDSES